MDIPVTVNEYSVSVSVVDESVSVAVTVNTISIDVSVNYGLNLTQVNAAIDAKIDEIDIPTKTSELENDSHFITENDIPAIPSKTSELENDSGFIDESALTKENIDGLTEADSPEFADAQITTLATEATYTAAVWTYLLGLFTTVPKSVFQHIVKGWTVMQNLAARVYLLEHNLIYSITLTENVSSLVINLPSPEYDVEIEVDYTWDSDAATSATLRVNGVSGSHYVSSSSQSYIGFISYCARYSAKGIYRLTLINGYVFCQTAIEQIYGSTSVQTPTSRTMQGYLKIAQSAINTITFDHIINSGSTIIVRRIKKHE